MIKFDENCKHFYYVHNRGKGNPTYRHNNFWTALDEAKRLSKLEKKNYYVLKAVAHVTYEKENNENDQ